MRKVDVAQDPGRVGTDRMAAPLIGSPGVSRAYLSQETPLDPDHPLKDQIAPVPTELLARCGISGEMLDRRTGFALGWPEDSCSPGPGPRRTSGLPPAG